MDDYLLLLPNELRQIIDVYVATLEAHAVIDLLNKLPDITYKYKDFIDGYNLDNIHCYIVEVSDEETYNIYFNDYCNNIFKNKYLESVRKCIRLLMYIEKRNTMHYYNSMEIYMTLKCLSLKYKGYFIHPTLVKYFLSKGIELNFDAGFLVKIPAEP